MKDTQSLLVKYAGAASGAYRELLDSTQQATIASTTNVVVLIQSKIGPIMNPIYVEDKNALWAIFGKRDRKLEQRGNFGILMCEHVLEQGPIWVMNIKGINPLTEKIETVQLPANKDEVFVKQEETIATVYDTTKFWKLNKHFNANGDDVSSISFASVLNSSLSFIVTKEQYNDYNYTVDSVKAKFTEFGGDHLPNGTYVSDYMFTVHIFKTDLNNTILSNAYVQNGKVSKANLELLKADPKAKYFASYTGSIGDVIDINGNNLNISTLINADTLTSGIFCTINNDAILENAPDLMAFDSIRLPATHDASVISLPTESIGILGSQVAVGSKYIKRILFDELNATTNKVLVEIDNSDPDTYAKIEDFVNGAPIVVDDLDNIARVESYRYISDNKIIKDFDTVVGTVAAPVQLNRTPFPVNSNGIPVYPVGNPLAKQPVKFNVSGQALDVSLVGGVITETPIVIADMLPFTNDEIQAISKVYGTSYPIIEVTLSQAITLPKGAGYVPGATPASMTYQYAPEHFQCVRYINDVAKVYMTTHGYNVQPWSLAMANYDVHAIHGIVDIDAHYVNGTAARQNAILDAFASTGIINSFRDPLVFKCRYMVDSFKTYIEPNAKAQLALVANTAKRFPVFIPAPFYHELLTSKNPSFLDANTGMFNMKFVAMGYNPNKISSNSFSYANSAEHGPWLIPVMNVDFNDGFAPMVIPATGITAKSYYSKHSGTNKIYDIIGGKDWPLSGKGVVGPEHDFDIDERAAMESVGTNVIVKIDGIMQLRSSLTAYQSVDSALNAPETIEKFLYLADAVEPIIDAKLFKYNNTESRTACKNAADKACDIMVADGAIGSYENQCDLDNNPVEVRSRGLLILDSVLYNEFGIRIGIHRTELALPKA